MNGFDDDFLEFLRTNHPTDYILACSDDVKPDKLSRIFDEHKDTFHIWIKVPYAIRAAFGGKVPQEIMYLAATGKEQVLREIASGRKPPKPEEEKARLLPPPPSPEEVMAGALFMEAMIAGYSRQAAYELSAHRLLRDALKEKALTGTMNHLEREAWRQSRREDILTIKKDWNHTCPEKLLIHLFSKYNRGKINKDEFLPQITDLMQKIETSDRREHLLAYLKTKPLQAKLAHFREDVLDILSQTVLHDIPPSERRNYLRQSIPLKIQIHQLIEKNNAGHNRNLAQTVNNIVEQAEKSDIGLDFSNYTADSHHPMSAELRQMFMIACCIHDVPYRSPDGERINPNSEMIKQLPTDIQALVISRDMHLAKETMIGLTDERERKCIMSRTMPSVLLKQKSRQVA